MRLAEARRRPDRVAMDDAERVGLAQRTTDLAGDVRGALLGEAPGLPDGPVERVPLAVRHIRSFLRSHRPEGAAA